MTQYVNLFDETFVLGTNGSCHLFSYPTGKKCSFCLFSFNDYFSVHSFHFGWNRMSFGSTCSPTPMPWSTRSFTSPSMPTSKRRLKDSFAVATSSFQMNIPEIVSWQTFEVWRNEFLLLLLLCRKLNLQCTFYLRVFGKHLFILFLHFRFLINILLLTDNAKHELNNVGSLSPERTVLRADSRVRVLAKESSVKGQGIVLGVVCPRCWLH